MLHYLKIFSWLLFTFAVVGLVALLAGLEPTMTSVYKATWLLVLQTLIASVLLLGFKFYRQGKISQKLLLYSGWTLIAVLVIAGQIWINL
ncbi:hypothetical protein [Gilvimarinus sp. DA14]|uniref:hypothetical protein n=1 Tax=Gilvimarinus sp. DA14 TaxID=2956798 RepID=UPI0020B667D5|nr:hypothetical protein [Gilvimarinus sp. DA14]UTF61307.1 hypothetical protein NHM04_05765 [Gilvimarinus sp. DA14]